MKATEILVKEHSLILQAVECLAQAKEKLEVYEGLPQNFFEMAVELTQNFADKYNHFKEEFLMFGLLAQKKTVPSMAPSVPYDLNTKGAGNLLTK